METMAQEGDWSVSVFAAARHVCRRSDWRVTNLKLQKILYLAHMSFVGQNNGALLIREPFEAWDYGPVVRALYNAVKMFGNSPIQDVFFGSVKPLEGTVAGSMLSSAWDHLKEKTAGELVSITHVSGGAWAQNYVSGMSKVIPTCDILKEYRRRVGEIQTQEHALAT
jgi:uncharacterized phage-associated protein